MKKKLLILALIIILITLVGFGTLAYFTTEGRATNVITTGTVELTLTEMQLVSVEGENGQAELKEQAYPDETITGIMPGTKVSKIPYIENTGTADFYARARAVKTVVAADGETELPNDVVSLNIDSEKWIAGDDGWYYYNELLKPGDKPAFFSEVAFAGSMGNEYQNCTVTIAVDAQGVQTKNNPIPEGGVTEIPGWPAENAQ